MILELAMMIKREFPFDRCIFDMYQQLKGKAGITPERQTTTVLFQKAFLAWWRGHIFTIVTAIFTSSIKLTTARRKTETV